MILLSRTEGRPAGDGPGAVLLLGSGRLGSAIREALEAPGGWRAEPLPFTWSRPAGLPPEAEAARSVGRARTGAGGRAAVVWAAGVCGFAATEAEAAVEAAAFEAVLSLARGLAREGPADLHLLSSAGGLFEGVVGVTAATPPAPRRPYGRLKAEEERRALAAAGEIGVRVYRASSVYGPIRDGHRLGLVSTLVRDCVEGRVTPIWGDMGTLRDYVLARDVGAFAAAEVREADPGRGPRTALLASGRAASIREILDIVGRVAGRECRIDLREDATNRSPITFAREALPAGWAPTDLEAGVREVHADFLARRP